MFIAFDSVKNDVIFSIFVDLKNTVLKKRAMISLQGMAKNGLVWSISKNSIVKMKFTAYLLIKFSYNIFEHIFIDSSWSVPVVV